MEKIFQDMISTITKMSDDYDKKQVELYKKQAHKSFKIGEWVTDGKDTGIVSWIRNEAMGISESDGFFGLDIKNGNLGFSAPCKRNDFDILCGVHREYYLNKHHISIDLTGEEIDDLLYRLGHKNVNPSKTKSIIIDELISKKPNYLTAEQR